MKNENSIDVRRKLIEDNLYLVDEIISYYQGVFNDDDLLQEGRLALVEGILDYQLLRDGPFQQYIIRYIHEWIAFKIRDELSQRENDRILCEKLGYQLKRNLFNPLDIIVDNEAREEIDDMLKQYHITVLNEDESVSLLESILSKKRTLSKKNN